MKDLPSTFLFILLPLILHNETLALTNYQIREICQKERKKKTCQKNLEYKKLNLNEGRRIEIPVIPHRQ